MLAQHEKDTLPCWLQEQSAVRYTKYEGILQAAEQKVAMNMLSSLKVLCVCMTKQHTPAHTICNSLCKKAMMHKELSVH